MRIVICGGGAAAALLLEALAAKGRPIAVTVIEPRAEVGPGLAYSSTCAAHLLSKPAGMMSATSEPGDFVDWLRQETPDSRVCWTEHSVATRKAYGRYLQDRVARIRARPHVQLAHIRSCADALVPQGAGWEVVLARGEPVLADVVVLATGHDPCVPLAERFEPRLQFRIIEASDTERLRHLPRDADLLLVGESVVARDVIAQLTEQGHRGALTLVRGQVVDLHELPDTERLSVAVEHTAVTERFSVRYVVNCSGPQRDITQTRNPLLQSLLADRLVRPRLSLSSLDSDKHFRVRRADGLPYENLYAAGSIAAPMGPEVTIPQIRDQVAEIARDILQFEVPLRRTYASLAARAS